MLDECITGDEAVVRYPFPQIPEARMAIAGREYRVSASVELPGHTYVFFQAWEPSTVMGPHATISTGWGRVWGAIRSRRQTDEELPLSRFPYASAARIAAVEAHTLAEEARALEVIYAAHPWLREVGSETDGDVMVRSADVPAGVRA